MKCDKQEINENEKKMMIKEKKIDEAFHKSGAEYHIFCVEV